MLAAPSEVGPVQRRRGVPVLYILKEAGPRDELINETPYNHRIGCQIIWSEGLDEAKTAHGDDKGWLVRRCHLPELSLTLVRGFMDESKLRTTCHNKVTRASPEI